MSAIQVEAGLRVRFDGRDPSFREGVEIGLLLRQLADGPEEIICDMSIQSVEQALELVARFGYFPAQSPSGDGTVEFRCFRKGRRPQLRVIGSSS